MENDFEQGSCMKNLILLLAMILFFKVHAAEDEKKYTEKELKDKVLEQVKKKVDKVKKTSIAQLTKELLDKERVLEEKENMRQRIATKFMDARFGKKNDKKAAAKALDALARQQHMRD